MTHNILGHDGVRTAFGEALAQGRLHHAWLLYGVQGIGKAGLAQQLAALFLCQSPDAQRHQACGQCHACAMMHAGSHPDFAQVALLFDDKKKKYNRDINIAQIREALDFLALSGLKSQKRVLMIDDANLMNNQAANALLKGLEEPSEGSLLLIVCHDLMRLPATIRSRCMLQACSPLDSDSMRQVLQHLGVAESYIDLAMALGQGSPGSVALLQEHEHAQALQQWKTLVEDVARFDIGKVQQWLDSHVKIIPHDLIAGVVVWAAQHAWASQHAWQDSDNIFQALMAVAKWPKEVAMHTLRPAPALMAYMLQLRSAMKTKA